MNTSPAIGIESRVLTKGMAQVHGTCLADAERFHLVLGITCHAIYHAGQIPLIKRIRRE
jgi:hypothetical protein